MATLLLLLQALRGYFPDTDDPTPGDALVPPQKPGDPQPRDNERLLRLYARALQEEAQLIRDLRQRVAALEARLP
jgi:hypothetical protein